MPIEIRELVVRGMITPEEASAESNDCCPASTVDALPEPMVEELVKRILQRLREREER